MIKRLKISLNTQMILGAALGIAFGYFSRNGGLIFNQEFKLIAEFLGMLFISLLKMIVMPLIFLSVMSGILQMKGGAALGKLWGRTLGYFMGTSIFAGMTGLFIFYVIQPGKGATYTDLFSTETVTTQLASGQKLALDFMGSIFQNPITALANQNILAAVIFAVFLGIALLKTTKENSAMPTLIEDLYQAMIWMTHQILKLAPLGIFGLLFQLAHTQSLSLFTQIGGFIAVVFVGTIFHGVINLPLIFLVVTRKNPYPILLKSMRPLLLAFSTSSSSATLPATLDTLEKKLGVDKKTGGFVATLGATINMDGTVLYEAMAALFVANLLGIELTLAQQLIVVGIASLASVGAPGIPSAGMVTMIMVLQSVGLPKEAIAILLPIDRLLDTIRTMVNVEGDILGAVMITAPPELTPQQAETL